MVRIKNKIHAHTDELYPGLEAKSSSFLDSIYGMRFLKVLPKPKTLLELSFEDWQRLLSTKDYELPRHLAVKLRDKSKTIVVNEHKNFKTLRDYVSH